MRRQITTSLCLVALVIYAASLFLPAFTCAHTKSFPGYAVLAIGFMGVLGLDPRCFGNLCFLLLLIASLRADSVRRPGICSQLQFSRWPHLYKRQAAKVAQEHQKFQLVSLWAATYGSHLASCLYGKPIHKTNS